MGYMSDTPREIIEHRRRHVVIDVRSFFERIEARAETASASENDYLIRTLMSNLSDFYDVYVAYGPADFAEDRVTPGYFYIYYAGAVPVLLYMNKDNPPDHFIQNMELYTIMDMMKATWVERNVETDSTPIISTGQRNLCQEIVLEEFIGEVESEVPDGILLSGTRLNQGDLNESMGN